MVRFFVKSAVVMVSIALASCTSSIKSYERPVLTVKRGQTVTEVNLSEIEDGLECQLTAGNRKIRISMSDCILFASLTQNLKTVDSKVKHLDSRQRNILKISTDAAVISVATQNLAQSLKSNNEETIKTLARVEKEMGDLNKETKVFLANLIEQYRILNARIDKSVPNYKE